MEKTRTLVIINPTSGTRSKPFMEKRIRKCLMDSRFECHIVHTEGPFHATELAKKAAGEGVEVVFAVGGDGTVNEVATGLMHTQTALGIIPIGSGNGLARHLLIPTNIAAAFKALEESEVLNMDVCTANDHPFFNVAGVGYDAQVAHDFAKRPSRGFSTYVQSVIDQWFKYKPKKFEIHTRDGSFKKKALMITVANGSQFGNNAFIAPEARFDDGLMDICLLYQFPTAAAPIVAFQLFNKAIDNSKYLESFRAAEIHIKQKSNKAHLDGEPFKLGKKIHFKVLPGVLNVLAPPAFLAARNTQTAGAEVEKIESVRLKS